MQEGLEGDLPIKVEGRVFTCMVVKPAIVHQGQVLALVSDYQREAVIHSELSRADKRLPIKVRLLALHKGKCLQWRQTQANRCAAQSSLRSSQRLWLCL